MFDQTQPKIVKVTFGFPELASACKKSGQFIN